MKIAIVSHSPDGAVKSVRTVADSALLRSGDPLFVADHLGRWSGRVCPAVRLSRLGTNIPLKAAGRYFDSYAPVLTVSPLAGETHPEGISDIADRSVAAGEWTPAEELGDGPTEMTVRVGGSSLSGRGEGLRSLFERTIHELSRYCTFKTGDILIVETGSTASFELVPDTSVECNADGTVRLNIRLK
jgi:2-keto-4-pentenoate hydratase/2-oxohepta-3-ene-1,7-dioic acid hydratase in catechol pathway